MACIWTRAARRTSSRCGWRTCRPKESPRPHSRPEALKDEPRAGLALAEQSAAGSLWKSALLASAVTGPSVPGQASELIEIEVPTAEHADYACPGRCLDQSGAESRHCCRCRSLRHQLLPAHQPYDRLEDVGVWERDDLVDRACHELAGELTDTAHPQSVDNAVDRVECHYTACPDRLTHAGCARRFHADDASARGGTLDRQRNPGDQASAADWNHDDVCIRYLVDDLQPKCGLTGDEVSVVERMDVGQTLLGNYPKGLFVGLIPDRPVEDHLRSIGPGRGDFGWSRVFGHDHDSTNAIEGGGQGDALGVVAR